MKERPEIDRWILSLLNSLVKDVDGFLDTYEPTRAGRAISDFVNDNLSNWYVRLNRRRFWGGGMTTDRVVRLPDFVHLSGNGRQVDGSDRAVLCRPVVL